MKGQHTLQVVPVPVQSRQHNKICNRRLPVYIRKILCLLVLLSFGHIAVSASVVAAPAVTFIAADSSSVSGRPGSNVTAGYCQLTVKAPVRVGSSVKGEASVTCPANANIDLKVTVKGPNPRTLIQSCPAVKYCSLQVSSPYAKGIWRTEADSYAVIGVLPWHDYKLSSPVSF